MRLVVGCPYYARGWIVERWFDHLADWPIANYVFVFTPGPDTSMITINDRAPNAHIVFSDLKGERDWANRVRVMEMVWARNDLLRIARHSLLMDKADAFLSLDSDILVPPWAEAQRLFDNLQVNDAVSPLVFLGPGTITNVFTGPASALRRVKPPPHGHPIGKASVLCAAIAMSRQMVLDTNVFYQYDRRGEDFGWSEMARNFGYQLGYDFSVKFKHVMDPKNLDVVDRRLGW